MTRSFRTCLASPRLVMLAALLGAACRSAPSAAPRSAAPVPDRAPAAMPAADTVVSPSPAQGTRDSARAGYTAADVAFVRGMIGHHAQALAMTALVPARSRRDDLALLARRIDVSQRDEIALMRRWLLDRGEPVPDESAAGHAGMVGMAGTMPGMLTAAGLDSLAATSGRAFERLFLADMIRHHRGALSMVAALLGTPGSGQEPALFQFASDVDADQRAEIARMEALARSLDASTRQARDTTRHR